MKPEDKQRFASLMATLSDYYQRKNMTADVLQLYWAGLSGFDVGEVEIAASKHLADERSGAFFPKISDLVARLKGQSLTANPGPEEAWAICARLMDPAETAVITDAMREAWAIAWPVMDMGDEVGARMAFRETYLRLTSQSHDAPRWEVQPGENREIRARRVAEAVQLGRLPPSAMEAHGLPSPTRGVAGLLEGARQAARKGLVSFHAAKLEAHLSALREALGEPSPDDGIDRRQAEREAFEAHREAELRRLAKRAAP